MPLMDIQHNVSLKDYSTMRLGGNVSNVADIKNRQQLAEALAWAEERQLPVIMIGGGSNIYWQDEGFDGLLLVNKIPGFKIEKSEDGSFLVTAGAGEIWDEVVARTTKEGLSGIEALSLIPGTAGATPIQNVGAYGQDISQTLVSVEAYDIHSKKIVSIKAEDCALGYRSSRFKTTDKGRFYITAITMRLQKQNPEPPFYNSLQQYLDKHDIKKFTPQIIRDAVINIRKQRMPDPVITANNGSFFANPIISNELLTKLTASYGEIPNWPVGEDKVKLPAAWLIEKAGFKDFHDPETGMGTWPAQPLVLVNESAGSTAQLLKFRQKIINAVQEEFGIVLVQEPELLPFKP